LVRATTARTPPEVAPEVWRARFPMSDAEIADFCARWGIRELYLFGSILRTDFDDESDIDMIVDLRDGAVTGLREWFQLEEELSAKATRRVELVEKSALMETRNPYRKRHVLSRMKPVYVAG
jgi:uncharacterized protein